MRTVLLLVAMVFAAGCGEPQPPLVAADVRIAPAMPGMRMRAGYLELVNNTGDPIRITRVESRNFERVELHETREIDGVSRMRPVEVLEVPAHGSVRLQPGSMHLMLTNQRGGDADVLLSFYAGDVQVLQVTVPDPNR